MRISIVQDLRGGLFGLPLESTASSRTNDDKRGLEPVDLQIVNLMNGDVVWMGHDVQLQ